MKMKINSLFIIIITIIVFGSYFVSDSFAIDFVDSSGYTPSWAKGAGYHSVLLKCTEIVGDYSRDGDWCFEWTAYVLDQGVENFPQSTQGSTTSSIKHNISERVCQENKLCVVPGDYLKYKSWDTFDNFEEIAIVEFKEKTNDNTIRVFVDGFGSKPLTYNLNLKTGIETHNEYKNVNRPFNLLEPVPMKVGQKVFQFFEGSYETTIEAERTANLKELGLPIDIERTIMAAGSDLGNGDVGIYGYDKETGVLITHVEKYQWEGEEHTSGAALIETNMFSIPTKISSTTGASIKNNELTWSFSDEDSISTTMESKSKVTIVPASGSGLPGCEDTTEGCFLPKTTSVTVGGVIVMENTDNVTHTFTAGTPEEGLSGEFDTRLLMVGNSFEWSPDTIGEIPYFCMVHPWMTGEIVVTEVSITIPTTSKDETKQTIEDKTDIIQSIKPESKIKTSEDSDNNNVSAAALGAFIVFGIPAIIIGLFIARRKMKKRKEQKTREGEWKGV